MQTNRLFLVFLLAIVVASQLPAQTHKALTLEEAVKRDINGTEEQRTKQFPPYRIMGNTIPRSSLILSQAILPEPPSGPPQFVRMAGITMS